MANPNQLISIVFYALSKPSGCREEMWAWEICGSHAGVSSEMYAHSVITWPVRIMHVKYTNANKTRAGWHHFHFAPQPAALRVDGRADTVMTSQASHGARTIRIIWIYCCFLEAACKQDVWRRWPRTYAHFLLFQDSIRPFGLLDIGVWSFDSKAHSGCTGFINVLTKFDIFLTVR